MDGASDREFLTSVFLMEAWDTLAAVETGLGEPDAGSGARFNDLHVVTHRLRGSAALSGFPGVSALAGQIDELVERAAVVPAERDALGVRLAELAASLKTALEVIAATGTEPPEEADRSAPSLPPAPADPLAAVDGFFRDNPDVIEYFVPEASEHLDVMTQTLLAIEPAGGTADELATLFRAVHTLKGAAYTVGGSAIGDLAHRLEDVIGDVRDGGRRLTPDLFETAFATIDALRALVRSAEQTPANRAALYERAVGLLAASTAAAPSELRAEPPRPEAPAPMAVPLAPARRRPAPPPARPVRASVRVNLDRLDALMSLAGELTIARSRLERRMAELERLDEILGVTRGRVAGAFREFEAKYADPALVNPASRRQAGAAPEAPSVHAVASSPAAAPPATPPLEPAFAELEFDRYDDFNIMARRAGEIAADVSEIRGQLGGLTRRIRDDAARIQQLSGSLRGEIARARMVPLGRLFARFARQVRETARAADKTIVFEASGEAVELDNAVIEQITDSILHLLRNAVTHGIEPESERQAGGKPPYGTIRLAASHHGGLVQIEVADDGRGIDVSAIRDAALRGGFLSAEALAEREDGDLVDLVFLPGLSTAEAVTTAAGRGVGMDVVQTNVGRLGGDIEVDTDAGRGTRFTLRVPLTLALADALLVGAGAEVFAVPLPAVKRLLMVRRDSIRSGPDGETIEVEGRSEPLIRLDRRLGLAGTPPAGPLPVAVLRTGRRSIGVAVDAFLGKQEVVIRSLGAFLVGVGPFSGATVMGDGRVVLVLDPVSLSDVVRAPAVAPHIARERPGSAVGRTRRRVLLVDDSVSVRKFVGQMLEREGFEVVTANDGAEALDRLADLTVDVIVTDLEMPRVDGYELIRDLRRRPDTSAVPVIVLTTRVGDKHVALARGLGIEHYVTKPVEESAFVRLVDLLATPVTARSA